MGAYQYCDKCDAGMDAPTLQECIVDEQKCPSCDQAHYTTRGEFADAAGRLLDRIDRLEAVLALIVPRPPT